ncbi:helix-turn-helix domain-containing protein [Vagococcus fluvialis]|uniref:helix-turn-helix domain-containing protein n=1 Tax=Vagococcus fluvialis TaxID=2738 RepID=UPI003D1372AF
MNEGQLFRKLRKDRGLSLEQVADEMNSVSFISKFEKGNSNISMHRLERLLQNINVSFEEFLYLRELDNAPDLNQTLKVLRGYLTSDFYFSLAEIMGTITSINEIGFKEGIKRMQTFKANMNPKISWQKFVSIYCDICIYTYKSNLDESDELEAGNVMKEINYLSKPIVSYLYKVEDWGVFEVLLFRMFFFSFTAEQVSHLLKIAISRTKKEARLQVMANLKIDVLFSAFSYFVNFRYEKEAEETLEIARGLLKNERDLTNSTCLLFYEGWFTIVFRDMEKGLQSCYQAISIFKILDQPELESRFQLVLKSILKNKEEPDSYYMFV